MVPDRRDTVPPLTERLVTYSISGGETAVEALIGAFEALEPDVQARERTLYDHVATDAVDELLAAETAIRLEIVIWQHPVVLTRETVEVYAVPDA